MSKSLLFSVTNETNILSKFIQNSKSISDWIYIRCQKSNNIS